MHKLLIQKIEIMENEIKTFLRGFFYAAWQSKNSNIDFEINQCHIFTKKGGKFIFATNRGIAHVYGNTAFAFKEPENSMFDIVEHWADEKIWNYIKNNFELSYDECRISFKELCFLIENFGGIDYSKM